MDAKVVKIFEIEKSIFHEIGIYFQVLKKYSFLFEIDIQVLVAILYVERSQYALESIKNRVHNLKFYLLATIPEAFLPTLRLANCSQGFSHIKFNTAQYAWLKQRDKGFLRPEDLNELALYRCEPEIAIKVMCIVLKEHIEQWHDFYDISRDVSILSTLYNISDFRNKKPHYSPKAGGSVLPLIIDGEYIDGVHFGGRCRLVAESKSMRQFLNKFEKNSCSA